MKLSDCRSLDDIKRFREGSGESGMMWFIDEKGIVMMLFPKEYRIILNYSCDQFIWRDNKGNDRYEDLYNNKKEAKKIGYLKRTRLAREASDKAKDYLDWLLANPPEDN